jgi:chemotaxis signal transduction protein
MVSHLTLIVQTAQHRYAVRRDDVLDIKLVNGTADLHADDAQGRAYIGIELGPLLDPSDQSSLTRRRALVVPLRRRLVALLADRVESFHEHARIEALPALLAAQLRQPWATGAFVLDSDLIIQLDLRAVAHTALAAQFNEH